MAKFVVLAVALTLCMLIVQNEAVNGECPLASKVASCSPTCLSDRDCADIGGKCCSNSCNRKSCVERSKLKQENKYGSGGSGSYCGSTKCNSFEKCGTDPSTKKPKCVRA
uniref:WAP domain-containing protein n=1 Tax=Anopheles farauti TaxID=69004 RepID=A0A182QP64_9DIPT